MRQWSGRGRRILAKYCAEQCKEWCDAPIPPSTQLARERGDWGHDGGDLDSFLRCYLHACLVCRRACERCPDDPARRTGDCLELGTEEIKEIVKKWQQAARSLPNRRLDTGGLPLPVTHRVFGREAELGMLDEWLLGSALEDGQSTTPAMVIGPPGVGKSTLVEHWARTRADHFPDGLLHADLYGFHPRRRPARPADVLTRFLAALGVPENQIRALSGDLASLQARLRTELAGRRAVLLLDNASATDQILPLLCPSPSRYLITSRSAALLTRSLADRPLPLDVLDRDHSRLLLEHHLGGDRLSHDPDTMDRALTWCAGLPLAVTLMGRRLAGVPEERLPTVARELAQSPWSSSAFHRVRQVIGWSCRNLPAEQRRFFALLGLHDGPHFGIGTATALLGTTEHAALPLLNALVDGHLVRPLGGARYTLHSLLRDYAHERAEADIPQADRHAAVLRLLNWYLTIGDHADRVFAPSRRRVPAGEDPAEPAMKPATWTIGTALRRCSAEHDNLGAVVRQAVALGRDDERAGTLPEIRAEARRIAWRLPAVYGEYLYLGRHWQLMYELHEAAIESARACGPVPEGWIRNNLGLAAVETGRPEDGVTHCRRAIHLTSSHTGTDDPLGAGIAWNNLGLCHLALGNSEAAIAAFEAALVNHEQADSAWGRAYVRWNLGRAHAASHRWYEALTHYTRARHAHQMLGHPAVEGAVLHDMATAYQEAGDLDTAVNLFLRALHLREETDDLLGTALTLEALALAHTRAGRTEHATTLFAQALTVLSNLAHPHAEEVRRRLPDSGHFGDS